MFDKKMSIVKRAALIPIRIVLVAFLMILERTHTEDAAEGGPFNASPCRIARAKQLSQIVAKMKKNPHKRPNLRFSIHNTLVSWLNKSTLQVIELPEKLFLAGPGPRSTNKVADVIRISTSRDLEVAIKEGTVKNCKLVVGSQGLCSKSLRSEIVERNSRAIFLTTQASWHLVDPGARLVLASNPRYIFQEGHPNTLVTFIFYSLVILKVSLEVDGVSLWIDCDERGLYSDARTNKNLVKDIRHHDPLNNFALIQGLRGSGLIEDSCLSGVLDLSPEQYLANLSKSLA
jgi:hypothetical protein